MKKSQYKLRYLAAIIPSLWLAACNSGSSSGGGGESTQCNPCTIYFAHNGESGYGGNMESQAMILGDTPESGVFAADYICNHDESRPANLPNATYKALIVDGVNRYSCSTPNCAGPSNTSKNWVLYPNTIYLNTNESVSMITNANSIWNFNGGESPTYNPIILGTANFINSYSWTGESSDWVSPSVVGSTCKNWESSSASGAYARQVSINSISGSTQIADNTGSCINENKVSSIITGIMCVQQ